MTQPTSGGPATGVPTCYRHAGRETWIRCQRCNRPICPDCMRDAAVGFHCPTCVSTANKGSRQNRAPYGGERSADPRLTTYVIIAVNALVWLAIVATGAARSRLVDLLALSPTGRCTSAASPSQYYPSIDTSAVCATVRGGDGVWHAGVADGAWWQLLSSAFTHIEIWHVAMNMFALFIFGPAVEQILGRSRFLAVYVLGALGGSVAVLWLSDAQGSTVGASGALFGLLGALLVCATKTRLNTSWLMQNLVLGVVISVVGWRLISWQGHLGGFLGGAAAAAIIVFAPKAQRSLLQWGGLSALAVVLLMLAAVRVLALA